MTPEGKIKSEIDKYLKSVGAWYYKPVSNGMGVHGIPDYIICYKGLLAGIEAKAPGKKPTALQVMHKNNIEKAGGRWFLVDGEESLQVLKDWILTV